jgi:uncharacterized protein YggT (Ycf19 family)
MSVDRRKRVVVRRDDDHVHEEHYVEDATQINRENVFKITQFIWLMFGILEALIGFRIFLKLIAANPANWFASLVYRLSEPFLIPFQGITMDPSFQGLVLEISSVIALLVYALVAWAIVRLVWLVFYRRMASSLTTYDRDEEV